MGTLQRRFENRVMEVSIMDSGSYVVVYDISSDKERSRVDKILKGYGFRVQKSVFECRLAKSDKNKLLLDLEKLDIKTGFIKLYKEEYSFINKTIGKKPKSNPDEGSCFIV